MAYNTEELKEKAIKLIDGKKLFFVSDIFPLLGIASSTFYEHFPSNSSDYKDMAQLLEKNKVEIKSSMRSKWYQSDNATLQVSLMKMIGSDEERKRLSQHYHDLTTAGDKLPSNVTYDLSKLSTEALLELRDAMIETETKEEE